MGGFLGEWFLVVKALHIVSVIAWMAGMLYLPRLFVYHCDAAPGSEQSETFKVMERRLMRAIMNPAMMATWLFGLMMVAHLEAWTETWMLAKFALIVGMQICHDSFSRWRRAFAEDANRHGARFFRVMNEVPTVLMIGIVFMIVLKPFA